MFSQRNRLSDQGLPAILDWHVTGLPDGDLLERLYREHEMLVRGVAVAAPVGGEPVVRRAEVGGGDDQRRPRDAPPEVLDAPELEARAADLAALEQGLAEPHGGHPVPGPREVAVAARAADGVPGVGRGVVGGPGGPPLGEGGGGLGGRGRGRRRRRGGGVGRGWGREGEEER